MMAFLHYYYYFFKVHICIPNNANKDIYIKVNNHDQRLKLWIGNVMEHLQHAGYCHDMAFRKETF